MGGGRIEGMYGVMGQEWYKEVHVALEGKGAWMHMTRSVGIKGSMWGS